MAASNDVAEVIEPPKKQRIKSRALGLYLSVFGLAAMFIFESSSSSLADYIPSSFTADSVVASLRFMQREQPVQKEEKEAIEKEPLNILLLYADDWRHDSVGYASNGLVHTPFIDSLANRGITFLHNCVTTSICWISRATLYTGQYLSRHNSSKIREPRFYQHWNESFVHLLRSQRGYWVGHVGKWHFIDWDKVIHHWDFAKQYYGQHWRRRRHVTEWNQIDALQFLEERPKERPFFLSVCFFAPHSVDRKPEQYFPQPYSESYYTNTTIPTAPSSHEVGWKGMPKFFSKANEGRRRYYTRFGNNNATKYQEMMKKYYRLISEVDVAAKNIFEKLDAEGVLNETLVIFTTDNGLFHAEHGIAGKWYPHQESIRVPLVILDPRMKEADAGTKRNEFTLNVDLATTILGAANLQPAPRMQGRDIADLYLQQSTDNVTETWRDEFYYEHPMHDNKQKIPGSTALVRKDFKYMKWTDYGKEQLFDLLNDPYETNDLFGVEEHKDLLEKMQARHSELEQEVK